MFEIKFKDELDLNDLHRMKPSCLMILIEFYKYCKKNKLTCLITSLMEDAAGRVSNTHSEGRAFDASIRAWTTDDIDNLLLEFNKKYKNMGTAPIGKPPKVVIAHNAGSGMHLHFQVRRS